MKTVNKLDYVYRKLVVKAREKRNNTIDISDEEYETYYGSEENIHDYSQDYLTIVSLEDNNYIYLTLYCSLETDSIPNSKTISISIDNGVTWENKISHFYRSNDAWFIDNKVILGILNCGQKMLIKGNNISYGSYGNYNSFESTKNFNIEGNIMSLIHGDGFINQTNLLYANTFSNLFSDCTKLISAENLILPTTTTIECYSHMFSGCTSLITTPKLPATTLAPKCYVGMFSDCTSLTKGPELPATTLAEICYSDMFSGCISLTKAPTLPASILTQYCYNKMFNGCTNLNYIKCLATTNTNINIGTAGHPLGGWITGVASSGTFIKLQGVEFSKGNSGIPIGWTVQELDPETGEIVNEYINE